MIINFAVFSVSFPNQKSSLSPSSYDYLPHPIKTQLTLLKNFKIKVLTALK